MQNMWDILAKTLEYRSKYIHILNPTVREDIVHPLTAVTNCQICVRLKKAAERTKSRGCLFKVVDTRGPANFGIFVMRRRSASRLTRTPLACRRWQRSSIIFFSIKQPGSKVYRVITDTALLRGAVQRGLTVHPCTWIKQQLN